VPRKLAGFIELFEQTKLGGGLIVETGKSDPVFVRRQQRIDFGQQQFGQPGRIDPLSLVTDGLKALCPFREKLGIRAGRRSAEIARTDAPAGANRA